MSRVPAGCVLVKVLKDFDYLDAGAVLVMPLAVAGPLIEGGIVREVDARVPCHERPRFSTEGINPRPGGSNPPNRV